MRERKQSPKWSEYLSSQMLEVDGRLSNWAHWCYERIGGPGHCGSIEHKFLPARDDERAEVLQRVPIDALDAIFVEACVVTLPMGSGERLFLKSYYIGRHHWRQTCRMLRINPDLFPSAHTRAISVVGGLLHAAREQGTSNSPRRRAILRSSVSPSADRGAYRLPAWGSWSR